MREEEEEEEEEKKKVSGVVLCVVVPSSLFFLGEYYSKDEPQSGIELIGIKEIRNRIGSSTRDDFGKEKELEKKDAPPFSLSFDFYLACVVVVGLFSTLGETQKRDDDDDDKDDDDAVKREQTRLLLLRKCCEDIDLREKRQEK